MAQLAQSMRAMRFEAVGQPLRAVERTLRSVANLTRSDAVEMLALAPEVPVRTKVSRYSLEDANTALDDLRNGRFTGAAVSVL